METFTSKVLGREKTFTIGGKAKIIYCEKYLRGLGGFLENYKIGDVVTIVGANNDKKQWPIVKEVNHFVDPDCLEPLPSTAEQIQSEIAKHEKQIEQLKFQLSQLTLKES